MVAHAHAHAQIQAHQENPINSANHTTSSTSASKALSKNKPKRTRKKSISGAVKGHAIIRCTDGGDGDTNKNGGETCGQVNLNLNEKTGARGGPNMNMNMPRSNTITAVELKIKREARVHRGWWRNSYIYATLVKSFPSKRFNIIIILLSTIVCISYNFLFNNLLPLWGVPSPTISSNPTCRTYHPDILLNCKDIRPLPNDSPWAVISCDPSRSSRSKRWRLSSSSTFGHRLDDRISSQNGELYLWNWRDNPEEVPKLLDFKRNDHDNFHPSGISIVKIDDESKGGKNKNTHRLFVINRLRAKGGAAIEILDLNIEKNSYDYVMTLETPKISSPNGIVALDDRHFFVTNDHFFVAREWKFGIFLEAIFGLPLGETIYFSLEENHAAAASPTEARNKENSVDPYLERSQSVGRFSLPNGIELDREESKLYISSGRNGLWQYSYLPSDGDSLFPLNFKFERLYRTPYMTSNLLLSKAAGKKSLVLSGLVSSSPHQRLLTSIDSSSSESEKPPSWVLEMLPEIDREVNQTEMILRAVDPANMALRKNEWRWRSVFWDDGTVYGGISTAGIVDLGEGGKVGLLATSLAEEGVLVCSGGIDNKRGWLVENVWQDEEEDLWRAWK